MNATQSRSSSLEMEREKREAAQVATEANGQPKKVVVGIDNTDQPKTPIGIFKYIFNWYPKSKYSKEEIWLLRKMDMTIVTFGAFAFFLKYLDSTNINNAYVSGMREDLNIDAKSNDYAWFGFYYYIGYMVLQIPTVLVISRPGVARWLLPGVELLWGIITFAQVRLQNVESIFAIRFILGALAIPSYTGVNYVLGSWYKGDELFKRSAVFMMGNSLGQMFSGYLMAAVYKLDGRLGLPGWRWLFVVDGCITVPIALISFLIFPGLPTDKHRIWWLSAEEQELARKRVRDDGVAGTKKITVRGMLKIFSGWHLWVPVVMIIFFLIETYPAGQMTLWLKSLKNADGTAQYSIELINTIPTAIQAIIAVTTFLTGSLAGLFNIWYIIAFIQGVNLFAVVVLRIWTVPNGLKFAAYFMLGFMGAPNPIFFGWINRLTRRSAEERAVVLGAVFTFGWAFFAWVPLFAYRTPEAPRWTKGYSTAIACTILSTAVFFVGGYLHRREEQKYAMLEAAATNDDLAPAVADADRHSNYDEKEVPIHEEDVSRPTDGTMDREHATLPHTHQFSQTDREREAKILPQPNTTV